MSDTRRSSPGTEPSTRHPAIGEVVSRAVAGPDGSAALNALAETAAAELGCVAMVVLSPASGEAPWSIRAVHGLGDPAHRSSVLEAARAFADWIDRTGAPVSSPRVSGDPRFERLAAPPDGAGFAAPLRVGGTALGILAGFSADPIDPAAAGTWIALASLLLHRAHLLEFARTEESRRAEIERRLTRRERWAATGELAIEMARESGDTLARIRELIDQLGRHLDGSDDAGNVLHLVTDQLDRVHRSLDQVRDFSRGPELRFSLTDVNDLLTDALTSVEETVARKRLRVTRRLGVSVPPLLLEVTVLRRLFTHMLQEAVGSAPDGGRVKVETVRRGENLDIRIAGDGTRAEGQSLDRLFAPFQGAGESAGFSSRAALLLLDRMEARLRSEVTPDWPVSFHLVIPIAINGDRRRGGRDRRAGAARRRADRRAA